jgi:glycosyltransferase involved in cell wall biosynthesis
MTQYFYPEPGAPTNRYLSFARKFADKGHDVTVLCEFPNYPSGKLSRKYRFKLFEHERFEKFKIVRTWVTATKRTNALKRILNYASFTFSSLVVGLFLRRPDVILVSTPPLPTCISAVLLSIFKSTKLIGDIQDLWPEFAIAMGALRNKPIIKISKFIEKIFYWRCIILITVTKGFRQYLIKHTCGKKQVLLVYNGSSYTDVPELNKPAKVFSKDYINVCYAGNVGLAQSIGDIVDAAHITRRDDSIKYTIIGDGVSKRELESKAKAMNLENIEFTGSKSLDETNKYLLNSDISVVPLIELEIFKLVLPAKFFDCMAIGHPIILGLDGEARGILEKNKTGIYYKPGNSQDLVEKIRWLQANPLSAKKMGSSGRKLVINSFTRSNLADIAEEIITNAVNRPVSHV